LIALAAVFASVVALAPSLSLVAAPHGAPALASAATGSGGDFVPVQGRILDTRAGYGIGGYTTAMPANTWRSVPVDGQVGIPTSGVAAVAVNFTILAPGTGGQLHADKDGVSSPNTSVNYLSYSAGERVSNSGIIAVGSDGKIQLMATSTTDLLVDVQGYYTAGDPTAGGYVPIAPTRIVDTRNGTGLPLAKLAAGSTTTIQVTGTSGVPSGASAVMVEMTAMNQTNSTGHFTVYPSDESRPTTSFNIPDAKPTSFGAEVGLSTAGTPTGAFNFWLSTDAGTDLTVDVLGYFTASATVGSFTPAAARVYDTHSTSQIAGGSTRVVQVGGQAGVPTVGSGVTSVVTDLSVTDAGTSSAPLVVWADGTTEPSTTSLSYQGSTTMSNMVTTKLGANGAIDIHNTGTNAIDVTVDVEGWYMNLMSGSALFAGSPAPLYTATSATIGATGPSGSYVSYKWQLNNGTSTTWSAIPSSDVTDASNGQAATSSDWPNAAIGQQWTWNLKSTLNAAGYTNGQVTVRACLHTTQTDAGDGQCQAITASIELVNAYTFAAGQVTPQGSTPGADTWGGGSPSEPCISCDGASSGAGSGETVNTATQDVYDTVTDVSLPGPGVPLAFTRTYDAQAAQAAVTTGAAAPSLGYGWSNNLGMSLSYNTGTQTATLTEENGAQITFTAYVSGSSPAWCSSATNFCAAAPRIQATLNHNSDGSWTFTRSTGTQLTYTFSSTGTLTKVADVSGNTLTPAAYSPSSGQSACPTSNTCTAWTSSASGRELVVATEASGRITTVFDANSTLKASFTYTGSGCSSWSGSQTVDLCTATDPGNLLTSYTYDSGNSTAAYGYDLTGYTPPGATAAASNTYTAGKLSSSCDVSGNDVIRFEAAGNNASVTGGTATITTWARTSTQPRCDLDTQLTKTINVYSSNVLTEQTTGYSSPAAASTYYNLDAASLLPASSVDGNGNITNYTYQTYSGTGGTPVSSANLLLSTDALGNTTQFAYTAHNLAWCTVKPGEYANGVRCPASAPTSPPAPGATDPNLGMSISFYNAADQLTATTDALGNTTTYAYTGSGGGVPAGLQYCSVDPVDYQNHVTCPAYGAAHVSGTATQTFDANGDTLSSTGVDGGTTTNTYGVAGLPGYVSSETDPDGMVTTYSYDAAGHAIAETESFGSSAATTSSAYDASGRAYCQVGAYEYAQGVRCPSAPPSTPPTPSSDPYLGATITTFDSDGRVVQSTSPLGGISYTAFDGAGREFCSVAPAEAAANVTCPSTAPSTPPTPSSDPYLGATITSYDAAGQPVQVTNPLGGITLTSYDPAGNTEQTIVEASAGDASAAPAVITNNYYDAADRLVSTVIDPGTALAKTTLVAYNPDGLQYCTVSANNYASGTFQCPAWQNAWVAAPPKPSSLYSTMPTSAQALNVTTMFYNAKNQQIQTTNPDVATTVTAVDAGGRTYCTADATNTAAWMSAHPSGGYPYLCPATAPSSAPATGSNPGYSTTLHDGAGRTLSSTDPDGNTTSYTYAPGGQTLTTTNPAGNVTTNCYYFQNATGQCAHNAPAGGGAAADLYSVTTPATSADPSGQTTITTYYPGGLTNTITGPAGVTTNSYDVNGDVIATTYSATATGYNTPTNVTTSYNVDGSRHSVTDATGTTTYSYDADGHETSQSLTAGSGTGLNNATTSYGYYSTGVLASVTYPNYTGQPATPKLTYSYDATGAMSSALDWLGNTITFTHDSDGNPTGQNNNVSTANPTGTSSSSWTYDTADEPSNAATTMTQTCGGTETLSQAFSGTGGSRNADGQLTAYATGYTNSCSSQTGQSRNYSYDPAGRLIYQGSTVQGSNANNFAYDPAGDPTKISQHDASANFNTYTQSFDNAGELTAQTPISGSGGTSSTYSYDTLGDQTTTTSGGATTLQQTYDQLGRMSTATTTATTATYRYNADGLTTGTTVGSNTTQYTWSDAIGSLSLLLSDSTKDYLYGPTAQPIEQITLATNAPTYLTYTPANSSWITTNQAGQQTGSWGYDAYGTLAYGNPTSAFGYSGQYTDPTTGLINNRARWYQTNTGDFTTIDPALNQTNQPYTYAADNPISNTDPTGKKACTPNPYAPCGLDVLVLQSYVQQYAISSNSWRPWNPVIQKMKPAYISAVKSMMQQTGYGGAACSGSFGYTYGVDCGMFVFTLMRNSGWDTNYGYENGKYSGQTASAWGYLKDANNGWFRPSISVNGKNNATARNALNPTPSITKQLQPGDILLHNDLNSSGATLSGGHILVFAGAISGFTYISSGPSGYFSASQCDYPPAPAYLDTQGYTVFRMR
jgi:RHS repeat-associated protein